MTVVDRNSTERRFAKTLLLVFLGPALVVAGGTGLPCVRDSRARPRCENGSGAMPDLEQKACTATHRNVRLFVCR